MTVIKFFRSTKLFRTKLIYKSILHLCQYILDILSAFLEKCKDSIIVKDGNYGLLFFTAENFFINTKLHNNEDRKK